MAKAHLVTLYLYGKGAEQAEIRSAASTEEILQYAEDFDRTRVVPGEGPAFWITSKKNTKVNGHATLAPVKDDEIIAPAMLPNPAHATPVELAVDRTTQGEDTFERYDGWSRGTTHLW